LSHRRLLGPRRYKSGRGAYNVGEERRTTRRPQPISAIASADEPDAPKIDANRLLVERRLSMRRLKLVCRLRGLLIAVAVVGWFAASESPVLFGQAQTAAQPGTAGSFVPRVFKDAAGAHKYVLFIPPNYTADKTWPVILYLHGAGERGNDGVLQTSVGLGPFVKERAATFPFFVVFPQCEDTQGRILTAWSRSSPDGRRALAILDSVEKEFTINSNRRVLTGWSMGGYGTWSLGAAEPKRWSALVPVAGGGDAAWASSLKKIPIWSFEGANDQVVPARESLQIVEAIRAAGGYPLNTEIPDVGHDVWKIVYNDNRLYEWMLAPSATTPPAGATRVAGRSGTGSAAASGLTSLPQPGPRLPAQPAVEGPFIPAVTIPNALYLRLGNEAIRALAHSAPRLIPPSALTGRINDIYSSTETSGYTFSVQFAQITYSGQVERVSAKAYTKDLLNIQLGLRNVTLMIGSTYVQGAGRSAMAGPISVVIGNRYPVWLSFDVTPYVSEGKLRLQLVTTRFQIPSDDWYVSPPYGVSVSGLGMTQEKVASGLVEGIYGQKSRIEQEAAAIVPSLLPQFEERLAFEDLTQAANAFWPLPVYRPRLRVSPESVDVDENGISIVMGVTAAAVDPRKAPATPRVERSGGIVLDSVPRDTQLRLGITPSVLEPLTRMVIDEGIARVNVLDIPDKKFAAFADRKALSEILPDLASLPPNTELNAELVLGSPVQVRDAQPEASSDAAASNQMAQKAGSRVSVTALKANGADPTANAAPKATASKVQAPKSGPNRSGPNRKPAQFAAVPANSANGPRSFEFVVPKALIVLSVKQDPQAAQWKPYAQLEFDLTQQANAVVLRRGFTERALRIGWSGEPLVKASAKFAADYTPKNSEIRTDKLRDLFTAAWKAWTQNGAASQVPVPDVDFGYSKLRLGAVQWSPPALSVMYDEPGVKITNSSKMELVYETRDVSSAWGGPFRLKPGKSAEFKIFDPMLFRRVAGDQYVQMYTLPAGSHCEFRSPPSGGAPNLFQVPAPAVAR
jgi:poly(3-hydroxybutyrate) depolymerase